MLGRICRCPASVGRPHRLCGVVSCLQRGGALDSTGLRIASARRRIAAAYGPSLAADAPRCARAHDTSSVPGSEWSSPASSRERSAPMLLGQRVHHYGDQYADARNLSRRRAGYRQNGPSRRPKYVSALGRRRSAVTYVTASHARTHRSCPRLAEDLSSADDGYPQCSARP